MPIGTKIAKLLPNGGIARGISVLAGSTVVTQAFALLAAPILTRLYGPYDYGILAVFTALVSMLSVAAGLRYEIAVPLAETDKDAASLAALSIIANFISVILVSLAIYFYGNVLSSYLGVPDLAHWLWLVPPTLLLTGIYQGLYYSALRKAEYGVIARTRLSKVLAMLVVQLACYPLGTFGLLLGQAINWTAGFTTLFRRLKLRHQEMFRDALDWRNIRELAKRYSEFPRWSAPGALLNTIGAQLPSIMFAAIYGPVFAGLYALTIRLLGLPSQLVGQAISDVIFSNGPDAYRKKTLGELIGNIFSRLFWLSLAPAAILTIVAPGLFQFVFGAEWRESGEMVRFLVPWLIVSFIASALSPVYSIVERVKELFFVQALIFVMRIASIYVGFLMFETKSELVFILFSAASFIAYAVYLFRILAISGVRIGVIGSVTTGTILMSCASVLATAMASLMLNELATIAIAFISGAIFLAWVSKALR